MFSTLKIKIIFFITLIMVMTTLVNIYYTHNDVGKAMLISQEKSAKNILHSLDLVIKGDYKKLLIDKRNMMLQKRAQLKKTAMLISSVFQGYHEAAPKNDTKSQSVQQGMKWLKSAPFEKINYFIVNKESQIVASSKKGMTSSVYKGLRDVKQRKISDVMGWDRLRDKGDFAMFRIKNEKYGLHSELAFFLPVQALSHIIVISIDVSDVEAEAQKKLQKTILSISKFANQLNIAQTGFVYMFDEDNTVLISRSDDVKETMPISINLLTSNNIHSDIKAASKSDLPELNFISYGKDKKDSNLVYCSYFKSLRWYISVIVPVKEINAPAKALVIRQSIIIIAVFMAGLLAVFLLVTRITSPLNLLAKYARTIPGIDFTQPEIQASSIDDLPEKHNDEVGRLAASFILMRQELHKNILNLVKAEASKQKIESELNIARSIQLGMVPKVFPCSPEDEEFNLFATLIPAKEIGGDLYDFFMIDDTHLCFTLGDVSGKGVPAALFMVVTRTLIKTLAQKEHSPSKVMSELNNILSMDNSETMFVTLIIGVLNTKTGKVVYASGGHNPPVFAPKDKASYFVESVAQPVVGVMDDITFTDQTFFMSPGDGFFLYTDGVNEAMNINDEQYSDQKLLLQIEENKGRSVNNLIDNMLVSIREHTKTAPQSDDIAMMIIKYK